MNCVVGKYEKMRICIAKTRRPIQKEQINLMLGTAHVLNKHHLKNKEWVKSLKKRFEIILTYRKLNILKDSKHEQGRPWSVKAGI